MPFRNGFLMILELDQWTVGQCPIPDGHPIQSNRWTSTRSNRSAKTSQGLGDSINLKLWTEKSFGSFPKLSQVVNSQF